MDQSLGEQNELMQRASMWLKLYGCQAVRRKVNLELKTIKDPFLEQKLYLRKDMQHNVSHPYVDRKVNWGMDFFCCCRKTGRSFAKTSLSGINGL